MDILPVELLDKVISHLDIKDLISLNHTCISLRHASAEHSLWKKTCEDIYGEFNEDIGNISDYRGFFFQQKYIDRKVRRLINNLVYGPRDQRYRNVLAIYQIGPRAIIQLSTTFYDSSVPRKPRESKNSLCHAYYSYELRNSMKRAKIFSQLLDLKAEISDTKSIDLINLLSVINPIHSNYSTPVSKLFADRVDKLQQVNYSSMTLKDKSLSVWHTLWDGISSSHHNYVKNSYISVLEAPTPIGPIMKAILYQYFAEIVGLPKCSILALSTGVYCKIKDPSSYPDEYSLLDIVGGGFADANEVISTADDIQRFFEHPTDDKTVKYSSNDLTVLKDLTFGSYDYLHSGEQGREAETTTLSCALGLDLLRTLFVEEIDPKQMAKMIAELFPFDIKIFEYFMRKANYPVEIARLPALTLSPVIVPGPKRRPSKVRYGVGDLVKLIYNNNELGIVVGWKIGHDYWEHSWLERKTPQYYVLTDQGEVHFISQMLLRTGYSDSFLEGEEEEEQGEEEGEEEGEGVGNDEENEGVDLNDSEVIDSDDSWEDDDMAQFNDPDDVSFEEEEDEESIHSFQSSASRSFTGSNVFWCISSYYIGQFFIGLDEKTMRFIPNSDLAQQYPDSQHHSSRRTSLIEKFKSMLSDER